VVARIPQIRESRVPGWVFLTDLTNLGKNFKTRSKGLSPALFMWVVSGNATFALSICAAASNSKDLRYWTTNASWLAGVCCSFFSGADVLSSDDFAFYISESGSGFSLVLDSIVSG
jgi:hypothetical protein